jgi:Na+-translocating ferredoxin:NAD+ oxidoreductase RnfC subunit
MDQFLQKIQAGGVIGAGGAGFPTYVKLDCQVGLVIANGAECEPLLNKDQVLMQRWAPALIGGMLLAMHQVGADRGVIGIKKKHADTIAVIRAALPDNIDLLEMDDVYPAGDEVELVYEATGKRIPSGGLPKEIGVMINNVESFINLFHAAQGVPVTDTMLTVHGEVKHPFTAWLPVGMSYAEVIALAGGITCDDFVVIEGGPMMGSVTVDLSKPITKVSSGLLVLRADSRVATIKTRSEADLRRIGKAACDQCSICSSMCPRGLLGYPVHPHLAMRALQISAVDNISLALAAQPCSGCNLCTMWSCPEGLDPSQVCVTTKRDLREHDLLMSPAQLQAKTSTVHPLREYRKIPTKRLMQRLELLQYSHKTADFIEPALAVQKVTIPLSQHIGAPAVAVVKVGDVVSKGQLIGAAVAQALSVAVHASMAGTVTAISNVVVIERTGDATNN